MVTQAQVLENNGLTNVDAILAAREVTGILLAAAAAMVELESHGRNVYGGDTGGALAGFPGEVNKGNFEVYRWMVFDLGHTPNGVGPTQITSKGLILEMEDQDLRPWNPVDNMHFGFATLAGFHRTTHSWVKAGTRYNGSETYGQRLADGVAKWKALLAGATTSKPTAKALSAAKDSAAREEKATKASLEREAEQERVLIAAQKDAQAAAERDAERAQHPEEPTAQ